MPALADFGLGAAAVRRAWAALAYGRWSIAPLLAAWQGVVQDDSQWQAQQHGGYRPVACDLVGFWRPRLQGCPTQHDGSQAGKALPAIPLGITARVGSVGPQRLALVARLPHVSVITRLRLDAALYDPPPPRNPGQIGRPRLKGKRRPTLEAVLADDKTQWRTLTVDDWYGEGPREVEVATDTAVWYHSGKPPVAIRWVLIRDPQVRFKPQALLSTTLDHTPEQMLTWFVRRWTIEGMFEEARAHLGMETQRQWNNQAIARATPALLSLYSIITLIAHLLIEKGATCVRSAAWYGKTRPTFSDAIALVRRQLWEHIHFSTSQQETDLIKIPRALLERSTEALCYAA